MSFGRLFFLSLTGDGLLAVLVDPGLDELEVDVAALEEEDAVGLDLEGGNHAELKDGGLDVLERK